MDLDFYRTQYEFELDQRSHLVATTNIPIAASTFLLGGLSTICVKFEYSHELSTYWFSLSAAAAAIALACSVYFIFRSLLGYEYEKLADPSELRKHHHDLIEWHVTRGEGREDADEEFRDYLTDRLSEASRNNSENNVTQGVYISKATLAIAFSVVFIASAGITFLSKSIDGNASPQKVEIVGGVTVKKGE